MKLITELSTHVDEEAAALFRRRAGHADCTVSDLLRDLVYLQLYGVTYGEHVATLRRAALASRAPDLGQNMPEFGASQSLNDNKGPICRPNTITSTHR